ncbi:Do family serine endopeptidase [Prosthecobacter sp.]|uniref:Do family serine endopeptidase n=1 Tax=Prosthecobacter sp. TaxID=1965333 RepID=UPI002ABB6805|nr:Do family serine endopeptidase [Prosthecobacter sp.]MDZ4405255.1 Do family serine endopeptidase [Prosthecobacter sp.]
MKTPHRLLTTFACLSLLPAGLPHLSAQQPAAPPATTPPPLLPSAAPKTTPADFQAKIIKDASPLPNGGQLQMSYASVVDKILPSVVTIHSSAPIKTPEIDQIPPQLRPFFYRFFGAPDGFGGMNEDDEPSLNPRGKRGQPQRPQQLPEDESHQQRGVGSGMIISADGYILTNNHVIADAKKIEVDVDTDGSSHTYTAEVVGADPLTDVALIKINATGLKTATIGDSSKLRVGDIVLAAGAPMELSRSVTQGIVSALGRSNEGIVGRGNGQSRVKGYEDFIQTDASINPGNSGGPLVDAMGRVVGINTAILSRSGMNAGIGFAIPINMALNIVEDLLDDGAVQRGFLGVQITDLDATLSERLGIKEHGGAVVMMVGAGSPAEKAGIQLEDVIVSINGQRVDNSSRLRLIVSSAKPGTQIPIELMRAGKRITVNATLEALPEEALSEVGGGSLKPRPGTGGAQQQKENVGELVTGVTVQTLTAALRERHDVPANVSGVIVTKVDPESRAAAMGVEEGDVISHVNRKAVANAAEARTLAKGSDKTVLLRVWRKGDTMLLMIGNN